MDGCRFVYSGPDGIRAEFSMAEASKELEVRADNSPEPYRKILADVRNKLMATRKWCEQSMDKAVPMPENALVDNQEPLDVLVLCYESLCANNMGMIANGRLKDLYAALNVLVELVKLDIRQGNPAGMPRCLVSLPSISNWVLTNPGQKWRSKHFS